VEIAHIFNEIEGKKTFFKEIPFDIDFFEEITKENRDFSNITFKPINNNTYNFALTPIKNNSIISKLDDNLIKKIIEKYDKEVLLISGDFWGIQKFIFSDITNKNASKILRSRSAKVQILTKIVVKELENFGATEVLYGAGKFLVIANSDIEDKIKTLREKLDSYFLENYYGEAGFILSYIKIETKELDEIASTTMKDKLKKLSEINEKLHLNKFKYPNLIKNENFIFDIFNSANSDDDICKFCKKRVAKNEECNICKTEIELGRKLTKFNYMSLNNNNGLFMIELNKKWYIDFSNNLQKGYYDISNIKFTNTQKWQLKSYVALNNENIKTFEELQDNYSGLMALKADVDKLGNTFREFYYQSFKKFNRLSRELNFFFANYLPYFIVNSNEYKEYIYIIFAGGDDLFLIGRYDKVVNLAKDIREKFINFTDKKATLSMGLVMFKHNTPIPYISQKANEAEKRAKNIIKDGKDRNGIDMFGVTMKFDEFLDIENRFTQTIKQLKENETSIFYYKLIEIVKLANSVKQNPKNAIWKSKLNYLVSRNLKTFNAVAELNNLIEEYGEKLLPLIYLTIYKRRDNEL